MVPIVDNPKLGLKESNIVIHEGNGDPCKHLTGDKPGNYQCAIHNHKFYKKTPCFSHSQIEHGNTNCRLGEYILKRNS
jgi:hypothetical protein